MLRTSFLLQQNKTENNCVNTVDSAMVLAFCTSCDGPLSMYEVSFTSLVFVQRYAPDKLFIAKIKKISNSMNTVDRVKILTFYTSADDFPSMYQVSFYSLYTFRDILQTNFLLKK